MTRTLIRGGLVITAADEIHADVLIEGGRIVALAAHEQRHRRRLDRATPVIDATGKYVIPGGVDAHTHMEMPFGGTTASDTFETGTRAAAWGGTTTIVDFAIQSVGRRAARRTRRLARQGRRPVRDRLRLPHDRLRRQRADAQGDGHPGRGGRDQLQAVHGLPGRLLQRRRQDPAGHAARRGQRRPDHDARRERHRHRRAGRAGAGRRARPTRATTARSGTRCWRPRPPTAPSSSPGWPARRCTSCTSPPQQAVAELAAGPRPGPAGLRRDLPAVPVPVHRQPRRARTSRAPSTSARTPLRPREHQAALWQGLRTDDLQVVSTDHCPFCFVGQKELGRGDFSKIPNGMPGVENRMDLLHQAVVDGHITRRRWIEIACATPARMFGLYPRKGTIAPGADADVVIYDPHAEQVISARDPPHERGLLAPTRAAGSPGRSRPCSRAASRSSRRPTPACRPRPYPRAAPAST